MLLIGGAGTGKTRVIVERFAWLVDSGLAPEEVLCLTLSADAAEALRERIEAAIGRAHEELTVTTFQGFCAKLLRDEASEAGIDPFATPVTSADRLAMLLDRIDELPLSQHDLRGNPSALLGSVVGRVDRLKAELISAEDYVAWAAALPEDTDAARNRALREREFGAIYATHDRMLTEAGTLDFGDLVLRAFRLLRERPHVRARLTQQHRHVLVDEYQDCNFAQGLLLRLIAPEHLLVAGDDDQAIHRFRGAATKNLRDFEHEYRDVKVVRLQQSFRAPRRVLDAAEAVVAPNADRIEKRLDADDGGEVVFWRAASERAQAQATAADIERLITREGVAPESIAVLVRSVKGEGQAVGVALEERAVPYRIAGAAAFFERAEVRDLLAWLRLLVDPGDAGAVVRALARPPIELRSIDLARVTQIARRRKLDMVGALGAAMESPQIPPEARERILTFLRLYRSASGALDSTRADLFVHRMIERLGLRRQLLFAANAEVVDRLVNLAKFGELAATYARRTPLSTARDFARSISAVAEAGLREEEAVTSERPRGVQVLAMHAAKGLEFEHVYVLGLFAARMPGPRRRSLEPIPDALIKEGKLPPDSKSVHIEGQRRLLHVAMTRARKRLVLAYPEVTDRGARQHPSPFLDEAREAVGGVFEDKVEELFGPTETLQSTFRVLRDELMMTISQVGGRLGELRFDTDLDVSHAVVRYLEVMKLSALMERGRAGQPVHEALPEVNARLLQAVTFEQREIFETSALDEYLLDAERDEHKRATVVARRSEPSLEQFLPRRGDGLLLSASDIDTYRTCPLKYKFARVFRIPQEPTLNQRFGILIHQVLERFHAGETTSGLPEMLGLLDQGWRRGGFGESEQERQLRGKAEQALIRYHERFQGEDAEPVWFEKSFSFTLGAHTLRGRVDRVDRLADGAYELIDYKTGRPKKAADLREDVQLALYAVAAQEAWALAASHQAYYYILDDQKVPVDMSEDDREWITDTVLEVADGITSQGFEPTPSFQACSICDYRIACPAAER
ncbi:MAG: ATP-dependent helicase UvrD/PcrA [Solirubrobacteraceae bacterium]|nr:ATP-dependent helicase UvrD/PcrA [Solirubrobacteraceae bacterium]